MKITEVIPRQTRIIYTLMVIIGALGLVFAIWRHAHTEAGPAAPVAPPAATR